MDKIGIIGCGWLGLRLAKHFKPDFEVHTTTRTKSKLEELSSLNLNPIIADFDKQEEGLNISSLLNVDVIIITVPFSKRHAKLSVETRFKQLVTSLKKFNNQLFLMSSIGIYPNIDTDIYEHTFQDNELNETMLLAENIMKTNFSQVNILRLAGLMGDNRIFSNYYKNTPNAIANHIHYTDICGIIESMIQQKTQAKTYNVVAPIHPRKGEIFNQQKNENVPLGKPYGKNINGDLLKQELNYSFTKPNPVYF